MRGPGRVSCKNIKPECPALTCGQPRQLPGHCCKTCPQGKAGAGLTGRTEGPRPRGALAQARAPLLCAAERSSGAERPPAGPAFEYPRDPEHRSYSDRGEPGAEDRGRADGHAGKA